MKPVKRKPKRDTLSKHKKLAWKNFSLYIRTRDALRTTGDIANCLCVTCGKEYPRTGVGCIQAGHFIPGRTNAVLFSEEAVHGQCYQCNVHKYGNPAKYLAFMQKEYGQKVIDRLLIESETTIKYHKWEYDKIALKYQRKLGGLLSSV